MSQDAKKRQVAEAAFEKVRHLLDSETAIGIGTGSTANCFIDVLAESGIQILGAVASSKATEDRLTQYGIELLDLNATGSLPVYVDGADEADPRLNLIKGGGAALTREKIIAEASAQFICIADGIYSREVEFGDKEEDESNTIIYQDTFFIEQLHKLIKLSGLGTKLYIYTNQNKPLYFKCNIGGIGVINIYIKSKSLIDEHNQENN